MVLLDDSFHLLRANLREVLFLGVLLPASLTVVAERAVAQFEEAELGLSLAVFATYVVIETTLVFAASFALTHVLDERSLGRPSSTGAGVAATAQSLGPLLATGVVVGGLYLIGLALLVFPAFYLALVLFVVVPVCAVEDRWLGGCIARSRALMRGHKRRLVLLMLAYVAGVIAAEIVIEALAPVSALAGLLSAAFYAFLGAYLTCFGFLFYLDVRARDEDYDLERLALRVSEQRPVAAEGTSP